MSVASATGSILSVNVGRPREVTWRDRTVRSGIWKTPTQGRVALRGANLAGDDQADRRVHGGPDKAVYAYAAEDYRWWSEQLGVELPPASFGENLTTTGLDLDQAVVGETWRAGSALLQVTQPRIPCYKLGIRMGDDTFPERFADARRPGVYLRILQEGDLGPDDRVEVVSRPPHGFPALQVAVIYYDHPERAGELLAVAELAETWQHWAHRTLNHQSPPDRS